MSEGRRKREKSGERKYGRERRCEVLGSLELSVAMAGHEKRGEEIEKREEGVGRRAEGEEKDV